MLHFVSLAPAEQEWGRSHAIAPLLFAWTLQFSFSFFNFADYLSQTRVAALSFSLSLFLPVSLALPPPHPASPSSLAFRLPLGFAGSQRPSACLQRRHLRGSGNYFASLGCILCVCVRVRVWLLGLLADAPQSGRCPRCPRPPRRWQERAKRQLL